MKSAFLFVLGLAGATMLATAGFAGCTKGPAELPAGECAHALGEAAPRVQVNWKRDYAFTHDLGAALELGVADLCNELGKYPCAKTHKVSLGGSDPFGTGLYKPPAEPLATSALTSDRVALSACAARVEADKKSAKVFTHVNFAASGVDLANPDVARETVLQIRDLYHRLLAREPSDDEIEVAKDFTKDDGGNPVSPADFAKLLCFGIATSTESIFF